MNFYSSLKVFLTLMLTINLFFFATAVVSHEANQVFFSDQQNLQAKFDSGVLGKWQGTANIYYNAGNVSIGTSNNQAKLTIVGDHLGSRIDIGSTANYLDRIKSNTHLFVQSDADLLFGSGGANERMRITNTGNVGIGQSSPSAKLHVTGASSVVRFDGSTGAAIQFEQQNGFHRIAFDQLRFWDWQTGEMVTFENGNVGIGTTSPGAKLDVLGPNNDIDFRVRSDVGQIHFYAYNDGNNYMESGNAAWTASRTLRFTGPSAGAGTFNFIGNLCINNDCKNAWPAAGAAQVLGTNGNQITLSGGGGSITAPYATSAGTATTANGLTAAAVNVKNTDNTHYGYYEVKRGDNTRGAFFGWGNGGSQVEINLDAANSLVINKNLQVAWETYSETFRTPPGGYIKAGDFRDIDNLGYYVDPASSSILNNLQITGRLYLPSGTCRTVDWSGQTAANAWATSTALCSSSEFMMGGGAACEQGGIYMQASMPANTNQWQVHCSGAWVPVNVRVICCSMK
jgi:hypothetical protein